MALQLGQTICTSDEGGQLEAMVRALLQWILLEEKNVKRYQSQQIPTPIWENMLP